MIAEVAGAKCVAVPTALVVAHGTGREGSIAVTLAAKGETTWVQVCRARGTGESRQVEPVGAARVVRADELRSACDAAGGAGVLVGDRYLPEPVRSEAARLGMEVVEPVFDARACLAIGRTLPAVDPVELLPIYPREPEAVSLWRERRGGSGVGGGGER